jgi:monomeric sarcosine oxidase
LTYDAAIIGLGTMGIFAGLELARKGRKVIAFDQFAPPHDRGSHSGATRVFRTAYAEHSDYVPLAMRAGVLWDKYGAEDCTTFLHRTGMLSLGPPDNTLISGARASAAAHGVPIENLSRPQIRSRFPVFEMPVGWEGVLEPGAGWIDVNAALESGLKRLSRAGVDLRIDTRVEDWSSIGNGFVVRTSSGTFRAAQLIVTAGAWVTRVLADLALPLKVLRKVLIWVNPRRGDSFPIFASASKFFYGFPNIGGQGVKLAIHSSAGATATNIEMQQPEVTVDEVRPVLEAAAELLPSLTGPVPDAFERVLRTTTCFYTMTPDEHFLIDRHPQFPNLIFAAGFSGHGFKFAPVIGEALAELAVAGATTLRVGFLGLSRFRSDAGTQT